MHKVILYYKFVPLNDPAMTMRWQGELCQRLELKGRVIISPHGINGTLGGSIENLRVYKREMNKSVVFKGITYKWTEGSGREFPRLSIKVRDELVSFQKADEIVVDEMGIRNGGRRLKPKQVHELVKKRGDEVVFFDGRNAYEAAVGKFKNAVVPPTKNTRDFAKELDSGKYDELKNKSVVTYCTGGIRCEVLSAMMKNRGFKDVYQIDGGVVKYGQTYGDDGLWDGTLYMFDGRMNYRFSDNARDIGRCVHCKGKTSNFENCADMSCNRLVLICKQCLKKQNSLCENHSIVAV